MATFVAATDDRVVGVAAVEYDSFDEGNARICKLAVRPDHQAQGLGRELLKHRLDVLHADPAFDGLVYSAAVTSHPASQHNRSPVASNRTAFINTVRTLDVDRLVREEIEDV
jgi:GNAT superfamily N-acetyltransferase